MPVCVGCDSYDARRRSLLDRPLGPPSAYDQLSEGWFALGRFPFAAQTGPLVARSVCYILSIIALPKPEHETWVAPGIERAKS